MSEHSDYGDFVAWCEGVGLPMPVSNPVPEDEAETLQLDQSQTAQRAEWAALWPLVKPRHAEDDNLPFER